jgi:hypothetical protein
MRSIILPLCGILLIILSNSLTLSQLTETKLIASDGEESEYFGWTVALSGEYTIIGASEDDHQGPASGSAYIFKWTGQTWIQSQKLLPSDGASYDTFGNAVAISDSYAVIGAQLDDDNGTDSGSLCVFRLEGDTWIEQVKLKPNDGAPEDHFGSSVAISGDRIVAGCSLDDDNGVNYHRQRRWLQKTLASRRGENYPLASTSIEWRQDPSRRRERLSWQQER